MAVEGEKAQENSACGAETTPMEGRNAQKLVSGKTDMHSTASYICQPPFRCWDPNGTDTKNRLIHGYCFLDKRAEKCIIHHRKN